MRWRMTDDIPLSPVLILANLCYTEHIKSCKGGFLWTLG